MKYLKTINKMKLPITLTLGAILLLVLAVVIENPASTSWSENGPLTKSVMILFPALLLIAVVMVVKGILKK